MDFPSELRVLPCLIAEISSTLLQISLINMQHACAWVQSVATPLNVAGKLPAVILDAERRKNPNASQGQVLLNGNGEEVIVLDD